MKQSNGFLSMLILFNLIAVCARSQEALYAAPSPVVYGVAPNGSLVWYRHLNYWTGDDMPAGKTIGFGGWQYYRSVFANGKFIYGVTSEGNLNWYNYAGYQSGDSEVTGAKTVGFGGWDQFKSVFGGGDGVIYAITNDGRLLWYKYEGEQTGNGEVTGAREIGYGGGGWDRFKFVFSGGSGIIYAVTTDGDLSWYKHNREGIWETKVHIIARGGWQMYKFVFSGGRGNIYAVGYDGNLYWYNHQDYLKGASSLTARRQIGTGGWDGFVNVFPAPTHNW